MSNDQGKRFAERAAGTASEALEEGGTAAENRQEASSRAISWQPKVFATSMPG